MGRLKICWLYFPLHPYWLVFKILVLAWKLVFGLLGNWPIPYSLTKNHPCTLTTNCPIVLNGLQLSLRLFHRRWFYWLWIFLIKECVFGNKISEDLCFDRPVELELNTIFIELNALFHHLARRGHQTGRKMKQLPSKPKYRFPSPIKDAWMIRMLILAHHVYRCMLVFKSDWYDLNFSKK